MGCYRLGKGGGWICGDLGPHCTQCGGVGNILCDYPVGDGKTCDRQICDLCTDEIGPDLHYCAAHRDEWERFRESGGVKRELENVIPYKRKDGYTP